MRIKIQKKKWAITWTCESKEREARSDGNCWTREQVHEGARAQMHTLLPYKYMCGYTRLPMYLPIDLIHTRSNKMHADTHVSVWMDGLRYVGMWIRMYIRGPGAQGWDRPRFARPPPKMAQDMHGCMCIQIYIYIYVHIIKMRMYSAQILLHGSSSLLVILRYKTRRYTISTILCAFF